MSRQSSFEFLCRLYVIIFLFAMLTADKIIEKIEQELLFAHDSETIDAERREKIILLTVSEFNLFNTNKIERMHELLAKISYPCLMEHSSRKLENRFSCIGVEE
jgi:hypothetical protein